MSLEKIQVSGKDVLYAVVFIVTVSGTWYKVAFQADNTAAVIKSLQEDIKDVKGEVRMLQDDKIKRDALDDAQGKYYPVQKVK